jgi:O-antigen ligase
MFSSQIYFFITNDIDSKWWLDWKYNHNFLAGHINEKASYLTLVIILNILFAWFNTKPRFLSVIWVIIQVFTILLLSSRALIIYLFIVMFLLGTVWAYNRLKLTGVLGVIFISAGLIAITGEVLPVSKQRFKRTFQEFIGPDHNQVRVGGINTRLGNYKSSIMLINDNPIWGVGIGDVREELVEAHKKFGFEEGVKFRYDAHNQFLQSYAATGVLGFITLLFLCLVPLIKMIKEENIFNSLVIISFLNIFMLESYLETHKGIVLFCLFMSISALEKENAVLL